MPNLFGPGAFGALRPAASRPAFTPANGVSDPDDWFQNCSSPIAADGTVVDANMLNHWLALFRRLVRGNRQTETNLDDSLLFRAARSQAGNFVPASGVTGSANAIALAFADPFASLADLVGTPLVFLAEAANTGPATLAVDGLAATAITWPDGTALAAGDIASGALIVVRFDGTAFRLLTCLSPTQVRAAVFRSQPVQAFIAPSATNNIPSGVGTKITNFGTITNGISDIATWNAGTSRLTVNRAGWWQIGIGLDTNMPLGSGYGFSFSVARNAGVSIVGMNGLSGSTGFLGPFGTASALFQLSSGDFLEAFGGHNFGATQNMPIRFTVKFEGA
jgi:hypothetical protein